MKKLFFMTFLCFYNISYCQIGINTDKPEGILHIDGKMDNYDEGVKTNLTSDDVIFTPEGNIGLGTLQPENKLVIHGDMKIIDGTEKESYMLISGSDGTSRWAPQKTGDLIYANQNVHSVLSSNPIITENMVYQQISITLTPGSWMVYFMATYQNFTDESLNIWWDLIESNLTHPGTAPAYRDLSSSAAGISRSAPGKQSFVPVLASYSIQVTATTTFYLWGQSQDKSDARQLRYSGEGSLWAIPV